MNIVFVFDGLEVGGIERVGIDYVKLLAKKGYNVKIVNLNPDKNNMYKEIPEGLEIIEYGLSRKVIPQRYAKGAENGIHGTVAYTCIFIIFELYNLMRKCFFNHKLVDVDVLIAFSGHFNDLFFVGHDFIKADKKIAWLHGAEFEYKMISVGYFDLYRRIKNLVCLSELCDYSCNKFNVEKGIKKRLIYNPVMINEKAVDQKKVESLRAEYGNFVLMVGRLAPDKDQKTAILAVKYIQERFKRKINILLAGEGPNRSELESFVSQNKINDSVVFLGNCFDIQNYYSAAYVFVHSSPMEGLPTVVLEALSYGLPIAATDSLPGVREILKNNEFGLISPVGDYKSLGENIERLYEDELLRAEYRRKGKNRLKDFQPNHVIRLFEEYLTEI